MQNITYKISLYSTNFKTAFAMKPIFRCILPLFAGVLLAIPVPVSAQSGLQLKTVVIDPGHGGKDAGCVSRDKKTYEKNITLDIGKRLAGKIATAYPDLTVKMTRTDDNFVELENRAVFANKAGANLFISIHVNSVEKGTTANGYSIHCLGQSKKKGNDLYSKNLDLVKRENAVIKLEDNYQTTYQGFDPGDPQSYIIFNLMQNAHLTGSLTFAADVEKAMGGSPIRHSRGISQDPFWVLWRTAMPSVLIEVGFITNPDDLATMRSEKGRDGIAENIFQAFKVFKTRYDGSMQVESAKKEEPEKAAPANVKADEKKAGEEQPKVNKADEKAAEEGPLYGIQILATGKDMDPKDPFFHGYEVLCIKSGKLNKYIVCAGASLKKVKQSYSKVQHIYKDSYLVKIENNSTSPIR